MDELAEANIVIFQTIAEQLAEGEMRAPEQFADADGRRLRSAFGETAWRIWQGKSPADN
ncbi:hypothetical protein [Pseudolabrys sp. Root1462]|jgi:hypothetical protein|uniref:hypothetical protein n=1 Tax=Pseudolabrys sp. Root1462 TaxID=1736466 RepID=UPI00138F3040|nr:hypothetical protein [Pseudolabrys sp. Root1462]